ncbi:phage integrase Arm DNA-binding domain-containing protein [Paraburkholderia gardini]|uniref:phage integrase Arm DNA-binding domain-containing protein n=1 Tax=Paraburkholderia gardini TaxID=2823469 RepID=UPI001E4448AB|nr:phage integrase Arm DNA-binding domain-containing protein [Paraburkholderia gardini]
MAARPRIRRRANWPDNLHEPRPGYYTRRDPRDGKTHIPGRIDLALAIFEAQEVNRRQS